MKKIILGLLLLCSIGLGAIKYKAHVMEDNITFHNKDGYYEYTKTYNISRMYINPNRDIRKYCITFYSPPDFSRCIDKESFDELLKLYRELD